MEPLASNFIGPRLVEELNIKVMETPMYIIEIGTREQVKIKGVCKNLKIQVQGVEFQQHFFLIELGGTEMVLGMDWLASLGNIEANFRNLSLKWVKEGSGHIIRGDPELSTAQASWKAVLKALQGERMGFYAEYQKEQEETTSETPNTATW